MKKKTKTKYLKHKKKILLIVLFAVVFILAFYYFMPSFFVIPGLSTYGFKQTTIEMEVREDGGLIKLADECYEISMVIGKDQAVSIQKGLAGVIDYRPNTHDLIKDMLNSLDIKILMVKITEMKDGTYFAKLFLKKGNLVLSLDSRPSDAIAIAARTDYLVDIYVKEDLLKTVGKKIC